MKIIALYDNYEPQQFDGKVYLMADSSLAKSGKPWFLPEFAPEFTYQTHIVIRIADLPTDMLMPSQWAPPSLPAA